MNATNQISQISAALHNIHKQEIISSQRRKTKKKELIFLPTLKEIMILRKAN